LIRVIVDRIKKNLYQIIPMICIVLWAIYALLFFILVNINYTHWDFTERIKIVRILLSNPKNLYHTDIGYYALPSHIILFVPFGLMPIYIANYLFYLINILLAILFIREFNKILYYMDLKENLYRFIFLMIISNGFVVYRQFWLNNVKFIVGVILFFIIRRELQFRIENREKNLKYYWINYGLFVMALGIFPPFIYLLFIYLFQDIRFHDLFKKRSVKIYSIILIWFAIQNFIIFIYPSLIFDLFTLYSRFNQEWGPVTFFYLKEFLLFQGDLKLLVITVMSIVMGVITFIIILNKKLQIEEKFVYFCFISLFLYMYAWRVLIILLPFTLLLFIQFLKKEENFFEFIKKNKIISLGMFSIVGINFMPEFNFTFYKYIPMLEEYPFHLLVDLRWIFFITILGVSMLILHIKKIKLEFQNFESEKFEMN